MCQELYDCTVDSRAPGADHRAALCESAAATHRLVWAFAQQKGGQLTVAKNEMVKVVQTGPLPVPTSACRDLNASRDIKAAAALVGPSGQWLMAERVKPAHLEVKVDIASGKRYILNHDTKSTTWGEWECEKGWIPANVTRASNFHTPFHQSLPCPLPLTHVCCPLPSCALPLCRPARSRLPAEVMNGGGVSHVFRRRGMALITSDCDAMRSHLPAEVMNGEMAGTDRPFR